MGLGGNIVDTVDYVVEKFTDFILQNELKHKKLPDPTKWCAKSTNNGDFEICTWE